MLHHQDYFLINFKYILMSFFVNFNFLDSLKYLESKIKKKFNLVLIYL
jgi:hypothetical protein